MDRKTAQFYFSEEVWEILPQYEKDRLNTQLSNHLEMKQMGFQLPQPRFVTQWEAKQKAAAAKAVPTQEVPVMDKPMPSATLKAQKRKQPAAADPRHSAKKVMISNQIQEVTQAVKRMEEHLSDADKKRALAQTGRDEFHGFSAEEIARSKEVAARLKAVLLILKAQYHAACEVCDEAEEAYRRELARQDQHHVAELDKEEAKTSAGSASEEQLAKDKQEESQEPVVESTEPRYPRRQRPEVNYVEPELLDEDEYLFCDRCQLEHQGVCPTHGKLQFVADRQLPKGYDKPDRAERTLPHVLALGESSIKGAGLGAWARVPLEEGIVFGSYEGVLSRVQLFSGEKSSGYSWIIKRDSKVVAELDASDSSKSNWMRFVNCAVTKSQQNIMPFQFQGQLYYRTVREVPAHTELMVYYGDTYARLLGIDTQAFHRGSMLLVPLAVFSCSLCQIGFTSPIRRDRHQRLSCRRRRFDEPLKTTLAYQEPLVKKIPAAFQLSAKLNEPAPESRKRLKCSDCKYSTDHLGHFNNHLVTHTGERRFPCTMCEYKATQKIDLTRHLLTHGDVKPFACTVCNYRAVEKSNLIVHMRLHTGEKPFKCAQCDYASKQSGDLTKHVRAKHTKERPFACTQCEYTCVESSKLARHNMLKHGADKKLSCLHCEYKTYDASNLKKHVAAKHKG